jgi:hypothetical protein
MSLPELLVFSAVLVLWLFTVVVFGEFLPLLCFAVCYFIFINMLNWPGETQ